MPLIVVELATYVVPAGIASVTNAVVVLPLPVFFTTSVYMMMPLVLTTLPVAGLAVFVTAMIGDAVTAYVVRFDDALYVVPAMLVFAATLALFEIVDPSFNGLLRVTTNVSAAVEFAAIDPIVYVTTPDDCAQLPALVVQLTYVVPAGTVSVTTTPVAGTAPAGLVTVIV